MAHLEYLFFRNLCLYIFLPQYDKSVREKGGSYSGLCSYQGGVLWVTCTFVNQFYVTKQFRSPLYHFPFWSCLTEISLNFWQEIFEEVVSAFHDLKDISSSSYARRTVILEIIANLRLCVLMLDVGCDDAIMEMFQIFFSVAMYVLHGLSAICFYICVVNGILIFFKNYALVGETEMYIYFVCCFDQLKRFFLCYIFSSNFFLVH